MKLLHSADWHLGLTRYGGPAAGGGNTRVNDQIATLERFVDTAIEHDVDAMIFAGDTFATRRDGPLERAAFIAATRRARDERSITTLLIDGNHDGKDTVGDITSASLRYLIEADLPWLRIWTEPTSGQVDLRDGLIWVVAMPYPHKRLFDAELAELDPAERVLIAGQRATSWIEGAAKRGRASGLPVLFIGHLTVDGSTLARRRR